MGVYSEGKQLIHESRGRHLKNKSCESREQQLGIVYFIRREDSKFIRIGFTCNLQQRLSGHKWIRVDIVLLHSMRASRQHELDLHHKFAASRVVGSWYHPLPVLEYLHTLKWNYFVATGSSVFSTPAELEEPSDTEIALQPFIV